MYTTKRNGNSLSDLVHLGRIVLFSSENFGVRIVPEVPHTWVMDHRRLGHSSGERCRSMTLESLLGPQHASNLSSAILWNFENAGKSTCIRCEAPGYFRMTPPKRARLRVEGSHKKKGPSTRFRRFTDTLRTFFGKRKPIVGDVLSPSLKKTRTEAEPTSRWNRPSATNTNASFPSITGAVQPRTSPGERGFAWGTAMASKWSTSSAQLS